MAVNSRSTGAGMVAVEVATATHLGMTALAMQQAKAGTAALAMGHTTIPDSREGADRQTKSMRQAFQSERVDSL